MVISWLIIFLLFIIMTVPVKKGLKEGVFFLTFLFDSEFSLKIHSLAFQFELWRLQYSLW